MLCLLLIKNPTAAAASLSSSSAIIEDNDLLCVMNENGQCVVQQQHDDNDEDNDENYMTSCVDMHERCSLWADSGECLLNPAYMLSACEKSCLVCVDSFMFRDDEDNEGEDLLQRAIKFSSMDVGPSLLQSSQGWNGPVEDNVQQVIRDMERYARNEIAKPEYDDIRAQCTNTENRCALWVSQGECDKNPGFMMKSCALACRKCHQLDIFNKCAKKDDSNPPDIHTGSIDELFESGISNRWNDLDFKVVYHPDSDSDEDTSTIASQPWLISFDTVLSDEECDHIVSLGHSLGWTTRTVVPKGEIVIGRTSASAICNISQCTTDDVLSSVFEKISSIIGVPSRNMEYIELLKYSAGESYGVHHDYMPDDFWKPAGTRAISVLLFLSEVDGGGAVGFPELDWSVVTPKKGRAVVWPNVLNSNPFTRDERMFHEALPVVSGTKYSANIWIHQSDWVAQQETPGCS